MDKVQRWEYEICEKQQDMNYFQDLNDNEKHSTEDKIIIAGILKEYWKKIGKWEGNKVSKKQAQKICKVKELLNQSKA